MVECEQANDWLHVVHPSFLPIDSPRWKSTMAPLLEKWEDLYKQYRNTMKAQTGSFDVDPEKVSSWQTIMEFYREKLIEGYPEDEVYYPAYDSRILAEAAAVYIVQHKYQWELRERNDAWGRSYAFAWSVAGDYFIHIKYERDRRQHGSTPSARRGAIPVCNPRATSQLWSGRSSE
eukprot:1875285-Prymnesium_polylepis.1